MANNYCMGRREIKIREGVELLARAVRLRSDDGQKRRA